MNKNIIGNQQAISLVFVNVLTGLGLFFTVGASLGHNILQALVPSAVVSLFLLLLLRVIFRSMPDLCITDVAALCGKKGCIVCYGLWIAIAFVFSALFLAAALRMWENLDSLGMPIGLYIVVICFLLAYGAYLGLNALARLTVLLCIIFGLLVLINTVWLIGDMQISRLLPIAPVSLPDFNSVSQKIIGCQFVLLPFIIFYLPHIKEKKQIYPTMIKGVLLAMAYYLLITLRNVLVFGDLLLIDNYPALRALRMIRWGGINYLEFPGVLMMLALIFCGGILLWWVMVELLAGGFKVSSLDKKVKLKILLPLAVAQIVAVGFCYQFFPYLCADFFSKISLLAMILQVLLIAFLLYQVNKKKFC